MSSSEDCIFCSKEKCKIIKTAKFFFIIRDTSYPVTEHHTLIITNRHVENYFDLNKDEIFELNEIDQKLRSRLIQSDSSGSLRIYDFHNEFEISEKIKEKLFEFVSQFMNIRSKKIYY